LLYPNGINLEQKRRRHPRVLKKVWSSQKQEKRVTKNNKKTKIKEKEKTQQQLKSQFNIP